MSTKKTTLNIDEAVMRRLKQEAARRGTTMSSLVEIAICRLLDAPAAVEVPAELPPLPSWDLGPFPFDVSSRTAMYEYLEAEHDRELYGVAVKESGPGEAVEPEAES